MLLTGWIFEEDTAALSEGDSRFSLVGVGWEACNSTALTSSCLLHLEGTGWGHTEGAVGFYCPLTDPWESPSYLG